VNLATFMSSVTATKGHFSVGLSQFGANQPNLPPVLHTISGLPSPVMSVKTGDSLSTTSATMCMGHWLVVVRAGIQVKPRFLAGEAEDEDVVPLSASKSWT
jgi:hypothetical protein